MYKKMSKVFDEEKLKVLQQFFIMP